MAAARKTLQNHEGEEVSTKEKLIASGIRLFSEHGYEATTTRMLTDLAGVNNASVYFHFGTKEHLYFEVLNTVAGRVKTTFQPLTDKIAACRAQAPLTRQQAWDFIENYVDLYIDIIKDPANQVVLYLLLHEQTTPVDNHRPITAIACRSGELILIQLLYDYWQLEDHHSAAIVSRLLTSSLIALAEHPSFAQLALGMNPDAALPEHAWKTIREYSLNSLKAFRPGKI